jgi:hypothetical protein
MIGGGRKAPSGGSSGAMVIGILVLVAWTLTGLYRVDEAERGIVQRFGAYSVTTMPGLHWHLPFPIEAVNIVNVTAVNNYPFRTEMLTADGQYVFIQMVVQYRRSDPVKYSFEVDDPESTLQDVTEGALREVVGTSTLEILVTEQRDQKRRERRDPAEHTDDIGRFDHYLDKPGEARLSQAVQAAVTIHRKRSTTATGSSSKPIPTQRTLSRERAAPRRGFCRKPRHTMIA